jgi:pilus assembly protein CpaC
MRAGQTLALAGLIQTRIESQKRGWPWLSDIPWAGAAFRRIEEAQNEIELVVTVRPELVAALDPHEVPACLPGEQTTSPNDIELYFRGYLEVPRCCPDGSCPSCQNGGLPSGETILQGEPVPANESAPVPQLNQSGAIKPLSRFPARIARADYGQARTSNGGVVPASGVSSPQFRGNRNEANRRPSKEDPGLFGRVGYDVLDYKE